MFPTDAWPIRALLLLGGEKTVKDSKRGSASGLQSHSSPVYRVEKLFGKGNPVSVQPQEKQTPQNGDQEPDTLWLATSEVTAPTAESQSSSQVVKQLPTPALRLSKG